MQVSDFFLKLSWKDKDSRLVVINYSLKPLTIYYKKVVINKYANRKTCCLQKQAQTGNRTARATSSRPYECPDATEHSQRGLPSLHREN